MKFISFKSWLKEGFINFDNYDLVDKIYTGAEWISDEHGIMTLIVEPDGEVYGRCDNFDFEKDNKLDAAKQLEKWGFRYLGEG